jgi:hypothetical protein
MLLATKHYNLQQCSTMVNTNCETTGEDTKHDHGRTKNKNEIKSRKASCIRTPTDSIISKR